MLHINYTVDIFYNVSTENITNVLLEAYNTCKTAHDQQLNNL